MSTHEKNHNIEFGMAVVASVFRFAPAIHHLATSQPGRDVSYAHPPTSTLIASDTRVGPRERLPTLFSRILINYGVVDGSLGGLCEFHYSQTIKCTKPRNTALLQPKIQYCKNNERVYVYARVRLSNTFHTFQYQLLVYFNHESNSLKLASDTSLHCRLT